SVRSSRSSIGPLLVFVQFALPADSLEAEQELLGHGRELLGHGHVDQPSQRQVDSLLLAGQAIPAHRVLDQVVVYVDVDPGHRPTYTAGWPRGRRPAPSPVPLSILSLPSLTSVVWWIWAPLPRRRMG